MLIPADCVNPARYPMNFKGAMQFVSGHGAEGRRAITAFGNGEQLFFPTAR